MSPEQSDIECSSYRDNCKLFVVGIGASAGGLQALEKFFENMPLDSGAAFVVVQHLSPHFKSLMKDLLEPHTQMEIHQVTDGMELAANSIFLIPKDKNLIIEDNKLRLIKRESRKHLKPNFPIDLFFHSLAKSCQEKAVGVILSGSGSDGSSGLKKIYEAGGLVLVQEPSTAEFD
ncbi:MAG: chemotaxis protein CheB, partial [Cyanobacteria bacterium J06649_11]